MTHRYRKRRRTKGGLPILLLLLLCVLAYFCPEPAQELLAKAPRPVREVILEPLGISPAGSWEYSVSGGDDDFEIHYLDVGEGLSVLVRSGGASLLYDGGDRDASSFVVSYLQKQGISHLDYLIASHYDADHINGLIGALHVFAVDTVLGPDYEHDSKTYRSFLQAVSNAGLAVTHPEAGASYDLGDASFTVLAPRETVSESNNNSIVIRIVNGSNSFLLPGDAQSESEESICHLGLPLKSDVICPGHHGSYNATSELFLDYTQPKYAVISCGAGNEYGHPHQQTLDRLEDYGVTVLRTDELGTIIARSDGETITWD